MPGSESAEPHFQVVPRFLGGGRRSIQSPEPESENQEKLGKREGKNPEFFLSTDWPKSRGIPEA